MGKHAAADESDADMSENSTSVKRQASVVIVVSIRLYILLLSTIRFDIDTHSVCANEFHFPECQQIILLMFG